VQNNPTSGALGPQSVRASVRDSKLCSCGRPPLECARETLANAEWLMRTRLGESPACCQGIARGATERHEEALRRTIAACSAGRGILPALREDADGRAVASRIIEAAGRELENLRVVSALRRRRATTLLRRKHGRDACPVCDDEPVLRRLEEQLRWCERGLSGDGDRA
jgi:hypothetical protein